jgi:hypothetical protein
MLHSDVRGTVFDSWQEQQISVIAKESKPALRPTQPPIQWDSRTLSSGVNRTELRLSGGLPPLPHMPSYGTLGFYMQYSLLVER